MWELSGRRLQRWIINNILPQLERGKYYFKYNFERRQYTTRRSRVQFNIDCPFTGTSIDHDILKPLLDFVGDRLIKDSDYSMSDLVDDCLQSWADAAGAAHEWAHSKERFIEESEERGTLFYEEGRIYDWGE